ncbi:hypothetical protein DSM03_104169 [Leeuwenhoekiella aestuarii]|nr:hypothetical protein DSM03_104169 [Leeuwenhoekiella aestuarii]
MVVLQKMNVKEAFDEVKDLAIRGAAEDGGKYGEV